MQIFCLINVPYGAYLDHGYALRVFAANLKIDAICTFIRKVFATKILLSGNFLLFVTLGGPPPSSGQNPKEQQLFFGNPSLTVLPSYLTSIVIVPSSCIHVFSWALPREQEENIEKIRM